MPKPAPARSSITVTVIERPEQWNNIVVKSEAGQIEGRISSIESKVSASIEMLFVETSSRMGGQGTALVKAFEREALERGATSIALLVDVANRSAMKFWANNGYSDEGLQDGEYQEFYKVISPSPNPVIAALREKYPTLKKGSVTAQAVKPAVNTALLASTCIDLLFQVQSSRDPAAISMMEEYIKLAGAFFVNKKATEQFQFQAQIASFLVGHFNFLRAESGNRTAEDCTHLYQHTTFLSNPWVMAMALTKVSPSSLIDEIRSLDWCTQEHAMPLLLTGMRHPAFLDIFQSRHVQAATANPVLRSIYSIIAQPHFRSSVDSFYSEPCMSLDKISDNALEFGIRSELSRNKPQLEQFISDCMSNGHSLDNELTIDSCLDTGLLHDIAGMSFTQTLTAVKRMVPSMDNVQKPYWRPARQTNLIELVKNAVTKTAVARALWARLEHFVKAGHSLPLDDITSIDLMDTRHQFTRFALLNLQLPGLSAAYYNLLSNCTAIADFADSDTIKETTGYRIGYGAPLTVVSHLMHAELTVNQHALLMLGLLDSATPLINSQWSGLTIRKFAATALAQLEAKAPGAYQAVVSFQPQIDKILTVQGLAQIHNSTSSAAFEEEVSLERTRIHNKQLTEITKPDSHYAHDESVEFDFLSNPRI